MANKKTTKKTWLYAAARAIVMPFYFLFYRLKVYGAENIPQSGAVLLCSNHLALKDPLILSICIKRQVCYMGKAELFKNRFLAALLRALGSFPVNRGAGDTDALANAYDLLDEGQALGIFIEGTRSKTGELLRPKTGAALLAYQSKAPVVPVCITGAQGKPTAIFKKNIIKFGKPISAEELNIEEHSSMQFRRASRKIMAEIAAMREESLRELGVAVPADEQIEEKKNGEERT